MQDSMNTELVPVVGNRPMPLAISAPPRLFAVPCVNRELLATKGKAVRRAYHAPNYAGIRGLLVSVLV